MLTGELETARALFLQELQRDRAALAEHGGFSAFWRQVELEAEQVEDQALFERWLADLGRDRQRLRDMQDRQREASGEPAALEATLEIIARLLSLLDDVERTLRRRLWVLRERLGAWVYLAGPGVKRKPRPKAPGEKDDDERDRKEAAKRAAEGRKKPKKGAKAKK